MIKQWIINKVWVKVSKAQRAAEKGDLEEVKRLLNEIEWLTQPSEKDVENVRFNLDKVEKN